MKLVNFLLVTILLVLAFVLVAPHFWRFVYPLPYGEIITHYAMENNLDPLLVASVIRVESNFNATAVSRKGARGLMQVLPSTGAWVSGQMGMGPCDPDSLFDPETNIRLGTWYLRDLHRQFGGNVAVALAAYNGGRGNVQAWLRDEQWNGDVALISQIPFTETRNYVFKVLRIYEVYQELYRDHNLLGVAVSD